MISYNLYYYILELQEFLIDYKFPLFRIHKNKPEGDVAEDWIDKEEWK